MDLIYIPEAMTCGFIRAPQYRDYEQPWNKDYFNYGKSSRVQSQRFPQHHEQRGSKENCRLCKENKRRSLAAYIRGKSRRDSCQEIHEEEEEHDTPNTKEESTSTDSQKLKGTSKDNEKEEIK